MKFRAENFEAEVTPVDEDVMTWVITAQGHKPSSLRARNCRFYAWTDRGWSEVCVSGSLKIERGIAAAIALLYSVPGVKYVEPDELKPTLGYCPECGAMGVSRELGTDGNDECERGHRYPSKKARHWGVFLSEWSHGAVP